MSDNVIDQSSSQFGSATPTPSAPESATQTPSAVGTPATPAAPPQAPATGVPDGYVPSYRLRETREAAIRESQERERAVEQRYQGELERYRAQVAALAGLNPQTPTQEDTVRQQFAQLFPDLSRLEQRAADLEKLLERSQDYDQQVNHHWNSYGRTIADKLFTLASDSVGAPLNDEAKRVLLHSFVGFVQSSPEMQARYEEDPTVVEDFWRTYQSSFIDPVRRAGAANVVNRIPSGLPQDAPSGTPRATPAPSFNSLDERAAAAWTQFNNIRRG